MKQLKPTRINAFLLMKLPSAYFCGVRLKSLNSESAITTVRHKWFNQNPFGSIYFAVQAMAAELSTGAIVMQAIQESGKSVSMLVASNSSTFAKKARGKINFVCNDGLAVQQILDHAITSGDGKSIWTRSIGTDEGGDIVSEFKFEWTLKVRVNPR